MEIVTAAVNPGSAHHGAKRHPNQGESTLQPESRPPAWQGSRNVPILFSMIRAVETTDLAALHSLLSDPSVARWAGRTPYDALAVTSAAFEAAGPHRIGCFAGERLLAYGTITRRPHDRTVHAAQMTICHAPDADPAELADALLDSADRWLAMAKLEVDIDAADPVRATLEARGFTIEARRVAARKGGGTLVDALALGRLRPGWVPDGPPRPMPTHRGRGEPVAVQIRHAVDGDLAEWAELHRHPTIVWGTYQLPYGSTEAWSRRLSSNDSIGRHAVAAVHGGRIVGSGALHRHAYPSDHAAVLGMSVHPDFQGCGVGRAILAALVELGTTWLVLSRIELEVYSDNTRAVALYESLGFVREGTRRAGAFRDGAHVDSVVMGRIASQAPRGSAEVVAALPAPVLTSLTSRT